MSFGVGTKPKNSHASPFVLSSTLTLVTPTVLIHQDVATVLGIYSLHHFTIEESRQLREG